MDKSKGNTVALLVEHEEDLTVITLGALQDAARRIDAGQAATSDAATVRRCLEIIHYIEQGKLARRESTVANTMEPAAA